MITAFDLIKKSIAVCLVRTDKKLTVHSISFLFCRKRMPPTHQILTEAHYLMVFLIQVNSHLT